MRNIHLALLNLFIKDFNRLAYRRSKTHMNVHNKMSSPSVKNSMTCIVGLSI